MKGFFLASVLFILFGFGYKYTYEVNNSTADVERIEGLYIFTDSKPVKEHEYLGTVDYKVGWGGTQYTQVRDKLIKRAKKEYPKADAVIISLNSGQADKADVIIFK